VIDLSLVVARNIGIKVCGGVVLLLKDESEQTAWNVAAAEGHFKILMKLGGLFKDCI
jgi:hypothetical protein